MGEFLSHKKTVGIRRGERMGYLLQDGLELREGVGQRLRPAVPFKIVDRCDSVSGSKKYDTDRLKNRPLGK